MTEMTGEQEIRALIGSWLAAEDGSAPETGGAAGRAGAAAARGEGPGGLPVPQAGGREVAQTARRLALRGLDGARPPAVADGLRLVAEALVVDEHPSASRWTESERAEAVRWVALLLHRFGEDGVQELLDELAG